MFFKGFSSCVILKLNEIQLNNQHSNTTNYAHKERQRIAVPQAIPRIQITTQNNGHNACGAENVEVDEYVTFEIFHLSTKEELIETSLGPHYGHFDEVHE